MKTTGIDEYIPVMRTGASKAGLKSMCEYINSVTPMSMFTIAEVGVFLGDSTEVFLEYVKEIYCIDPWESGHGGISDTVNMNLVYDKFMDEFGNNKKLVVLRMPSLAAARAIDVKFDMVYIDGLHDYESVKSDIHYWRPHIKPGGWIAGHDYHKRFKGVIEAVNEQLGNPDKTFVDMSWVKRL